MKSIAKFIDCFSPLTNLDAHALSLVGIQGACRYLGAKTHPEFGKGITPSELTALTQNGLKVVFIWEGNPTYRSYFTAPQGVRDATDALTELGWLGIAPSLDITVYFSVDFDANSNADFIAVDNYLVAVDQTFAGKYGVGVYGGAPVLEYLHSGQARSKPRHYWQTVAWSGGHELDYAAMYQYSNGQMLCGVNVDLNDVYMANPGYFPLDKPTPKPPQKPTGATYHLTVTNTYPTAQKAAEAALEVSKLGFDVKVSQN